MLRIRSGNPTYRAMAGLATWSRSGLSEADRGDKLSTWDCVRAYLRGLGITDKRVYSEWQSKWRNTQVEIHLAVERGTEACDGPIESIDNH
jgi:hypothetical protein